MSEVWECVLSRGFRGGLPLLNNKGVCALSIRFRTVRIACMVAGVLAAGLVAGGALPRAAHAQSLTTTFAANNSQNGNMFDLTASKDLTITSFLIHTTSTSEYAMRVYWRVGSYVGFETDSTGWNLLGEETLTGLGEGNPVALAIGGLNLTAGQTYGLYIVNSDTVADATLAYTDGDTVYANADLTFTPGVGVDFGTNGFNGGYFEERIWNGTINYTTAAAVPEAGTLTLALPAAALLGAAVVRRRRHTAN
jgi:hypothetical protein